MSASVGGSLTILLRQTRHRVWLPRRRRSTFWKLEARRRMNVIAFSSPTRPDWRWRIVTNAGEVIEESRTTFGSISEAVAKGRRRLEDLDIDDRSERPRTFGRSTSHLRSR